MAELVRMTTKRKSVVDRLGKENSKANYDRQYYLRNLDKLASKTRRYYCENSDKKAEYQSRNRECIGDMKRDYNLRKKLASGGIGPTFGDGLSRTDGRGEASLDSKENIRGFAAKAAYQRRYDFLNKEKKLAKYRLEYSGDSAKAANRRLYLRGRKERRSSLRSNLIGSPGTRRSWKTPEIVRGYFESIAPRLNISNYKDWNRVSRRQMAQCGGLSLYGIFGSLGAALQFAYPELRSDFEFQATRRSWRKPEIVREFFESIAPRLNISNYEDWYRVSHQQIKQFRGARLFTAFGSLGTALQYAYPEINWNLDAFSHRGKKSIQRWLKLKIEELLPGIELVEDYQHPDLNWVVDSDQNIELDLWIPQHRVGIEYQGEQHYFNVDNLGPSSAAGAYSERDTLKKSLCESRGITLIAIPYWWDGSMESLSATLYQVRPDVFPVSHGRPIPHEMPVLSIQRLADSSQMGNIE